MITQFYTNFAKCFESQVTRIYIYKPLISAHYYVSPAPHSHVSIA